MTGIVVRGRFPMRHIPVAKVDSPYNTFEDRVVFQATKTSPKLWRCDGCGRVSAWGPGWHSFGPASGDECLALACSTTCMAVARGSNR